MMMMMDIQKYYLGTPFPWYEYMRMLLSRFPEEIVNRCNLTTLAVDGWVYIEIRKGMYGLKQAGLLANQLLQKHSSPFGYYPSRHTPALWLHKTRPIAFSLIVDYFTVKYVGKQHADHLQDALLHSYELTTDWEGKVYSGMNLKWDYKNRTCDISMPGYAHTFQIRHTCLRHQNPVCNAILSTSSQGKTVHQWSKIHRIHLVLCKSSGPHRLDAS
jgi:hypothetical protein